MSEDLIKRLRETSTDFGELDHVSALLIEAADAIEELQRQIDGWIEPERKALIKSLPRWIPVTERLPKEYTRVIGFMAWKAMTAIEYQNGKWYSIDHLEPLPNEAVTHWMQLPEPPKEENNGTPDNN